MYKSNKLCKASLERQEGPPDVSMKEVEDEQSSSTGTHTTNPPYTTGSYHIYRVHLKSEKNSITIVCLNQLK